MILRPTEAPEDWKVFLAKPTHWRDGYSAKECALSWEVADGLPPEIARLFPAKADLLLAIPEYKVPLPGGARDSQNDVFALIGTDDGLVTCMIEAKRDETFGPTLTEWAPASSAGKTERLGAICDCLGLDPAGLPGTLRYQLFHRTASAILTARRFKTRHAAMIVQSFSPEQKWFADFADFCALFDLKVKADIAYAVKVPGGMTLRLGWAHAPLHSNRET